MTTDTNNTEPTDDCRRPAVAGPVQRQVRPGAEARWYCIDANGMAQLCANEADANWEVADNTKVFPKNAPYRAVRLVDSREPMTDDEVLKMWRASDFRGSGGQADWFAEGIRAAERAHGIGA